MLTEGKVVGLEIPGKADSRGLGVGVLQYGLHGKGMPFEFLVIKYIDGECGGDGVGKMGQVRLGGEGVYIQIHIHWRTRMTWCCWWRTRER